MDDIFVFDIYYSTLFNFDSQILYDSSFINCFWAAILLLPEFNNYDNMQNCINFIISLLDLCRIKSFETKSTLFYIYLLSTFFSYNLTT